MYKKIIVSSKYLKPNKRDLKWLVSTRALVKFNANNISLKDDFIQYNNMHNVNIINYNTLIFFNINNILSFKHNDSYYQIGINNKEKNILTNKLDKINFINEQVKLKDIISFVVVVICLLWPIIYFIKN